MKIPTASYEEKYRQYVKALQWLSDLGIKLDSGRTSNYEKVLKTWKDKYKTASIDQIESIFVDFVSSAFEINDLIQVYESFKGIPIHDLTLIINKLKKAVNGPVNISKETPTSSTARNFLFEALVAANLNLPDGMSAILDAESDTGVNIGKHKIWIECKRIKTTKKIESNVRKASTQLEKVMKRRNGSLHRGIVALDVSKTFHAGDQLLIRKNDQELILATQKLMDNFVYSYSREWQKIYKKRHKNIIGTIIRFSFMCVSEERDLLVNASQWAINPRDNLSQNNQDLLKSITLRVNNS